MSRLFSEDTSIFTMYLKKKQASKETSNHPNMQNEENKAENPLVKLNT